jgi:hypothetical protein
MGGLGGGGLTAAAIAIMTTLFPYTWRVRKYLPERHGEACRVLARGRLNSCLVEFARDGEKVVTNRWFVRRRREEARAG